MVEPQPPHPHPELDELIARIDDVLPPEGEPAMPDEPEGQPVQTDNRPRPEDGDQDVDQKITAPPGSPGP